MFRRLFALALFTCLPLTHAASPIPIGLNDPRTGNYKAEGLELRRGALLAVEKINREGGVLGRPLELQTLNSAAQAERARANVEHFAGSGVKMVLGGATSEEAIAAGKRARELGVLYFPTLAYANEVTGREGHRYLFRESHSAWMTARVLGEYLSWHLPNRRYHYISRDDAWARSMEDALRNATGSRDRARHGYSSIPAQDARREHFVNALNKAAAGEAEMLVISLLGRDLIQAMQLAYEMGLTRRMQIVVPNLTSSLVEGAGPAVIEGAIGTLGWTWQVPAAEQSSAGIAFVESYLERHGAYPGSTAASAFTIVTEWAEAARRSASLQPEPIIKALEDHRFRLLKGEQYWRAFDHQNIQALYAVRVKPREAILKAAARQDFFNIIHGMAGDDAAPDLDDWQNERGDQLTLR